MTGPEIDSIFRKYVISAYACNTLILTAVLLVSHFCFRHEIDYAVYVGALYSYIVMLVIALAWRWIMKNHSNNSLNFHIAVSGFRFLSALFTLTVCYIVVGREEIAPYAIILMIFYLLIISHHSLFFMLNNSFKK